MKNMNSFKSISRAIEYEIQRQSEVLDNGGIIEQETLRWDDVSGRTFSMRNKEDAQDYRYFPEPDLVAIKLSDEYIENIRKTLPELPESRKTRYMEEYKLSEKDARLLTASKYLSNLFEAAEKICKNAKAVANWILSDISRILNEEELEPEHIPFTGAELANILNEAAIIATKNQHNAITNDDLDEAVKKVTVGLEKTSRKISDKDKKLTAYHEAGHAIVSQFLPTQTAVKEISIVPRGVAGGYTMYKSDEDKSFISKTEMEEKLIALLGGRAAEKIVLDDISTGASNDIEVATEIAKNMVTVYGMSDVVGPICLKSSDGNYEYQLLGNNMEDIIGQEVKKLIDTAYKSAQQILLQNMDLLHAIAAELIAKEKINEEEFNKFFMQ